MNKKLLDNFVAKCTLGGEVIGVKIRSSETDGLATNFANTAKSVAGFLKCKGLSFGDDEFTLSDMSRFKSVLAILDDEITFSVQKHNDKPFAFKMGDGSTKTTLVLSNPNTVALTPVGKIPLTPHLTFELTPDFINKFLKGISALKNVEEVYFLWEDGVGKIALGYQPDYPSSCVMIEPKCTMHKPLSPVSFPLTEFREALVANKEMKGATLDVTPEIMRLTPELAEFEAEYYFLRHL